MNQESSFQDSDSHEHLPKTMEPVTQIRDHLPRPTKADPHRQLDWIFRDKMSLYSNQSTQGNYTGALAFYKRFLRETNNYSEALERDPRFFLQRHWDDYALLKVKRWIDLSNIRGNDNYLTSNTIATLFSTLKQTIEHAYEHSYIPQLPIAVSLARPVRETSLRSAYSLSEFEDLFTALAPLIVSSKRLLTPYIPLGVGKDPRRKVRPSTKVLGEGWSCWTTNEQGSVVPSDKNLRWYFENVMDCVPLPCVEENFVHHRFFAGALLHGGIKELYRNWGVSSFIDTDVIMPLLVELVAETGLNVEAALNLKRNCFHEAHPLTGLPYLEYEKPRSGGDKELHLTLYDGDNQGTIRMKQRQSRIIGNSINTILKLTEHLVEKANPRDRDYLFLLQPRGRKGPDGLASTNRLTLTLIKHWTKKIIKKHDLHADDGSPLRFNLSRFRPTKITDLVTQGYDFFDIMAIAGHASITTTLAYIDRLRWTSDFHRKIEKALTTIRNNKKEYERRPLPVAITRNAPAGDFVFKAPVSHCKNPYDPPQSVRNSGSYTEGDPCSYFNMCLSCENVLITEMNLPKLVAYRREISQALGNLNEIPRLGELYKKTKMILDEILSPEVLFTQQALDWAAQLADEEEFEVLDSFISRS